MNKAELIDAMAAKTGLTKIDTKKALESFIEVATETLKSDDKITLVLFGTFSLSTRQERKGRNPRTGAEITIPAKRTAKFKAGSDLQF